MSVGQHVIQVSIRNAEITSFALDETLEPSRLCEKVAIDCARAAPHIDSHSQVNSLCSSFCVQICSDVHDTFTSIDNTTIEIVLY